MLRRDGGKIRTMKNLERGQKKGGRVKITTMKMFPVAVKESNVMFN